MRAHAILSLLVVKGDFASHWSVLRLKTGPGQEYCETSMFLTCRDAFIAEKDTEQEEKLMCAYLAVPILSEKKLLIGKYFFTIPMTGLRLCLFSMEKSISSFRLCLTVIKRCYVPSIKNTSVSTSFKELLFVYMFDEHSIGNTEHESWLDVFQRHNHRSLFPSGDQSVKTTVWGCNIANVVEYASPLMWWNTVQACILLFLLLAKGF